MRHRPFLDDVFLLGYDAVKEIFMFNRFAAWKNGCMCVLCLFWFGLLFGTGICQPVQGTPEDVASQQIAQWGFPVGEELVYGIYWGAIPVAESVVGVRWKEGHEGEQLVFWLKARSNRAIALIYPVTIEMENVVRVEDFLPVEYRQKRREGRRRRDDEVVFDYDKGEARIWSHVKRKQYLVELAPDTRDLFTFMFYLRRTPLVPGSKTFYRVMSDDKVYDLWLHAADKEMSYSSLPKDPVPALEVVPKAAFEGVFRRSGEVDILLSRDARRIMLHTRANIPIGSIRMVLREVRGPGSDVWGSL